MSSADLRRVSSRALRAASRAAAAEAEGYLGVEESTRFIQDAASVKA